MSTGYVASWRNDRHRRASLAVAVALNVSFYALLVGIVLLAAGAIVGVVVVWGRVGLYACTVPIGVTVAVGRRMLVACWPRRPGVSLVGVGVRRSAEPALWALVDDVCRLACQPRVDEIRLVLSGGASCLLHGELDGRARRVLSLSLAYLQVLGEDELRAVVAHELAHFAGRDGVFDGRIASVRAALDRTHERLERLGSVLRYPLRWYRRVLLRFLASMSREREHAADLYAAQLLGPEAVARALRITSWVDAGFGLYWQLDLAPVLAAGRRPPVAAGFGVFMTPEVRSHALQLSAAREPGPFDTHPPLADRLSALRCDASPDPVFAGPAVGLLSDTGAVETALLEATSESAPRLEPIGWPAVAQIVYPPRWERHATRAAEIIADRTAADIPALLDERDASAEQRAPELDLAFVAELASALASALVREGWQVRALPSAHVTLCRGEHEIRPFDDLRAIWFSRLLRDQWRARCDRVGIADLSLACRASGDLIVQQRQPVTVALGEARQTRSAGAVETAAAPRRVVELALHAAERSGVLSRGGVWFAWGISTALVAILAATAVTHASPVKTAIVAGLTAAGVAWAIHAWRHGHRSRPRLAVAPDGLTIDHRGLLRAPLHVPRDALRTITVDPTTRNDGRRFPVYDTSEWADPNLPAGEPRFWFWNAHRPAWPTPYFGLHRQTPNMLVVLDTALPGPRVRRQRLHGPLNGEILSRLSLTIADVAKARDAVAELGFDSRLVVDDFRPPRQL